MSIPTRRDTYFVKVSNPETTSTTQYFSCLIVEMSFYCFISNNDQCRSFTSGGSRVILWEEIQPFVMYFRMFDPEKRQKSTTIGLLWFVPQRDSCGV